MKFKILILAVLSLFFSCKTYKLSKKDLEWQPYEIGDKLVFESNTGEKSTIIIAKINRTINPNDPLSFFPNRIESLFVNNNLLKLRRNIKGSDIHFSLELGSSNFTYPNVVRSIEEMTKQATNKGVYKIIANEYYDNMKDRLFNLKFIYWSKEHGYLGLEFRDGYKWVLKSFIRKGQKIYP